MDTKYHFLQNMNYVQITNMFYAENKKELNFFVDLFKGEPHGKN